VSCVFAFSFNIQKQLDETKQIADTHAASAVARCLVPGTGGLTAMIVQLLQLHNRVVTTQADQHYRNIRRQWEDNSGEPIHVLREAISVLTEKGVALLREKIELSNNHVARPWNRASDSQQMRLREQEALAKRALTIQAEREAQLNAGDSYGSSSSSSTTTAAARRRAAVEDVSTSFLSSSTSSPVSKEKEEAKQPSVPKRVFVVSQAGAKTAEVSAFVVILLEDSLRAVNSGVCSCLLPLSNGFPCEHVLTVLKAISTFDWTTVKKLIFMRFWQLEQFGPGMDTERKKERKEERKKERKEGRK